MGAQGSYNYCEWVVCAGAEGSRGNRSPNSEHVRSFCKVSP